MRKIGIFFIVLSGFVCLSFGSSFAQSDYSELESCIPGKYSGKFSMVSWEITVLKEESGICYLDYNTMEGSFVFKNHCEIPVDNITVNPSAFNPIRESYQYCQRYAAIDKDIEFLQILTIVLVSLVALGVTGFLLAKKIKKRKSQK